jgi:hypothetical protein
MVAVMSKPTLKSDELSQQASAVRNLEATSDADRALQQDAADSLEKDAANERRRESRALKEVPEGTSSETVDRYRLKRAVKVGEDTYLPTWYDHQQALPLLFMCGKLFAASAMDAAANLRREKVAELGDTSLIYTGPLLTQYTLDVYVACLDALKDLPLQPSAHQTAQTSKCMTMFVFITQYLGLNYSPSTHRRVRDCLLDLSEASIRLIASCANLQLPRLLSVSFYEPGYSALKPTNLRAEYDKVAEANLLGRDIVVISAPADLAKLFGLNMFSRTAKAVIGTGSVLDSWLLRFYSSHSKAAWLTYDYLHALSGSNANKETFRKMLNESLKKLQRSGKLTFVASRGTRYKGSSVEVTMPHFKKAPAATATPIDATT